MWRTIVRCGSLFGATALALALGVKWVPSALPALGAVSLCFVGAVLIWSAPTEAPSQEPATQDAPAVDPPVREEMRA